MDEPLGTIDADRRRELREWIREKQLSAGVTTVYVTHDQEEAMSLADRVVVMNNGLIEQMDAPLLVYDEPASVFAADFIGSPGMNLFRGAVKHFESWSVFCVPGLEEEMAILRRRPPGEAVLGIRAEFIEPNPAGPFHGTVVVEEYQGSFRSVHFDIGLDRLMVMRADPNRRFHRGERVRLLLHPKHVRLFDPVTGRRLPNG
jgi:ABC-type sugar transport system ATPase subunit